MNKAIFLDRDGVIVEDPGYVHKIEHFEFVKNAVKGLKLLRKNFDFFIVTNQSGIGRGKYEFEDFIEFNDHVIEELKSHSIEIRKTYFCPHTPEDNCECRKPKIKFLNDAKEEFGIDLAASFVVGDRKSDIELGINAGCKTVHVMTGHGPKSKNETLRWRVSPL